MMNTTTLWVCVDCMISNVNGEPPIDRPESEPEVWALFADDPGDITFGLLREEHEEGCDPPEEECSCEVRSFTWSSCDACGSHLGGERHAFTYWHKDTSPGLVSE